MTTPEDSKNCYHVQNHTQRCKLKPGKFYFNTCILWCNGVVKESFSDRGQNPPPPPPPGEI